MADSQRLEPHALSDSEPELLVAEKQKKQPCKAKTATQQLDTAGMSGHSQPVPDSVATPTLPTPSHKVGDFAELKSMFQHMKEMTERNAAYVELLAPTMTM